MNKQSNSYTILYIIVMVVVVGAALALCATSLRPRQKENADADKMRQILLAVHKEAPSPAAVVQLYDSSVTGIVVDAAGNVVEGKEAFEVNVADEYRKAPQERLLPLFIYREEPTALPYYILPMYGNGLWGPIWGYLSLKSDAETVYGAYFSHQGETPGLGAEIQNPGFTDQFNDTKTLFEGDRFMPLSVVKGGLADPADAHTVNGVSGGTITSKGVGAMLDNCLAPYSNYLSNLRKNNNDGTEEQ